MADWQDSLKSFLDANPDLPEGEEIQVVETDECPRQPRLDIVLEKKGRAGKMATIVTGFIIDDEEVSAIAAKSPELTRLPISKNWSRSDKAQKEKLATL